MALLRTCLFLSSGTVTPREHPPKGYPWQRTIDDVFLRAADFLRRTKRGRSEGQLSPAQPNSPASTSRIVSDMADNLEAVAVEQSPVLGRREACMIEQLVLECESARGFAVLGPGVEHQDRVVAGVRVKNCKHRSLSLVCEVEVAIPGEDAFKAPVECQAAHVGDDPFLIGQPLTRQGDHCWRGVHAGDAHSVIHQETRHWLGAPAAEIEYAAAPR